MIKYATVSIFLIIILSGFSIRKDKENTGNQRAFYECSQPMDIDKILFHPKRGQTYFHFDTELNPTHLKTMNFAWLDDNPKGYFTAYLINTSDTTFHAERQDGSLIMIQEALNEKGEWLPIEYWVYSGCGNSYFDPLELGPGKFIFVPIKKYQGNFKTSIRLKLKKDHTLFYSQSFKANIDKAQFQKDTNNVNGILYRGKANYLDK